MEIQRKSTDKHENPKKIDEKALKSKENRWKGMKIHRKSMKIHENPQKIDEKA